MLFTFLLFSAVGFSQETYYSTNGKNRLTKAELDQAMAAKKTVLETVMEGDITIELEVTRTEEKADSVIRYVKFNVNSNIGVKGPKLNSMDKPFPEMELVNLKGESVDLEMLKGKPTLINFWFTTCAPCIAEMPILNTLYEQYQDEFNFLAITFESGAKVEKFLQKHPFSFPHIVGAQDLTDKLELTAYPTNVILDKNGVIRHAEGGIPYLFDEKGNKSMGDGQDLIEMLQALK